MKQTRNLLTFLLVLILSGSMLDGLSQGSITLKGKVLDETGTAIVGASVTVKSSKVSTITDEKGEFTLQNVAPKSIVIISFIGYENFETSVSSTGTLNVSLKPSASTLDNVVVNALGFESKKDKLGYATTRISSEALGNSGEAGLIQSMAGKSSGLRVSRTSGDPGAGSQIVIRGQSTITRSTDPLIVVDGVPINGSARGESSGGQIVQQSRLDDISPDDIANVQILKGASAAALWGTRAANGVIIITTKKGTAGAKPTINFRSTVSFDEVSQFYSLQDTYGQGNNGVWQANAIRTWGDRIANRSGAADVFNTNGANFLGNTGNTIFPITQKNSRQTFNDKNFRDVFGWGHYLDNSLSMSHADSKGNYFFSLSDLAQKGVARSGSDYRRTSVRLNVGRNLNNWLSISNKATFIQTNQNRLQAGVNNAGLLIGLLRTPPDFDNGDYIGRAFSSPGGAFVDSRHRSYRNATGSNTNPGFNNPLWVIHQLQNTSAVSRFINSAEINIKPVSWFTLTTRAGLDYFTDQQKNYFPYFSANAVLGQYSRQEYSETQFNLDVIGRATHDFNDKFSGNLLFGFNYNKLKSTTLGGESQNFIIPGGPQDLNNATPSNIRTTDSYLNQVTNAGYTSIGMSWNDQLFFNATGRVEAASTFGMLASNTFFYPSADLAWQFTQLEAFKSLSWLSFGKLRTSYGIVGVQPLAYRTQTLFLPRSWGDGFGGSLDPSQFGTGSFVQDNDRGNPLLQPERKKEFEVGADLRFFKDKLSVGITVYQNETQDALISVNQAPSTGFNTIYANAGTIENKGIEIDLGYNVLKNKDWSLDVNLNWTRNRNLVTNLGGAGTINLGGTAGVSSRAVEGYPLGVLFSNKFLRDAGGKLQLNANGFPLVDPTAAPIGDPNPDWRAGFGFNLRYKKFYLNTVMEHSQGGKVIDGTEGVLLDYGTSAATGFERVSDVPLRRFNGTIIPAGTAFRGNIHDFGAGPVALDQSWYTGPGGWFGNVGELFMQDATWTRFREINLGYTINSKYLKDKIGLNSIGLELSGRNLFVISNVNGFDPDANNSGTTSGRGVVYFVNPPTRSYLFTVKLNF